MDERLLGKRGYACGRCPTYIQGICPGWVQRISRGIVLPATVCFIS